MCVCVTSTYVRYSTYHDPNSFGTYFQRLFLLFCPGGKSISGWAITFPAPALANKSSEFTRALMKRFFYCYRHCLILLCIVASLHCPCIVYYIPRLATQSCFWGGGEASPWMNNISLALLVFFMLHWQLIRQPKNTTSGRTYVQMSRLIIIHTTQLRHVSSVFSTPSAPSGRWGRCWVAGGRRRRAWPGGRGAGRGRSTFGRQSSKTAIKRRTDFNKHNVFPCYSWFRKGSFLCILKAWRKSPFCVSQWDAHTYTFRLDLSYFCSSSMFQYSRHIFWHM